MAGRRVTTYTRGVKLSIVILQTDKPRLVEECLSALSKARLPAETEIVVLDNGGKGANAHVNASTYATLPNVSFTELPSPGGYVHGNNVGYARCAGEYVLTLNPDITVHEDTVEKLLDYMERHPDVGLAAPRLVYPDGHEQDSARPFPSLVEIAWRRLSHPGEHRPSSMVFRGEAEDVDWVTGAAFVLSRKCLDATGGHDERFYLFMSDVALCRETWAHGMRVTQLRDASAIHNDVRLSGGGLLTMLKKKTGRWHLKDATKYFLAYGWRRAPAGSPSSGRPLPAR